jgi:uncharacterized protein (TIGR02266 family)
VPLGSRCWCEADGITLYARLVNVSEGGVFIRTFAPLQQGSPARLRFVLDGTGREVQAEAVVVWIREAGPEPVPAPGMGLRFVGIAEEHLQVLRDFVSRLMPPMATSA